MMEWEWERREGDSPVMVCAAEWNRAERIAWPEQMARGTYRPPPTPTRWRDVNASNTCPFFLALIPPSFPDLIRDFHFPSH